MLKRHYKVFCVTIGVVAALTVSLAGADTEYIEGRGGMHVGRQFFWIAIILVSAKLSNLVTRLGQPSVLGELLVGVVMGNLALVGFGFFEYI